MTVSWRIAIFLLAPLLLTGCQPAATKNQETNSNQSTTAGSINMNTEDSNKIIRNYDAAPEILPDDQIKGKDIVLKTTKGDIRFKLFAEEVPHTVSNFVFLTSRQFYDGLTFHRVEPNFVIQGGDPEGSGRGGPGYKFDDEPVKRSYARGIVAMANSGPNTNGSQFFIMLADTPLPPAYTIFGEVISGIEVVDQIRVGDTMTSVSVVDSQ